MLTRQYSVFGFIYDYNNFNKHTIFHCYCFDFASARWTDNSAEYEHILEPQHLQLYVQINVYANLLLL